MMATIIGCYNLQPMSTISFIFSAVQMLILRAACTLYVLVRPCTVNHHIVFTPDFVYQFKSWIGLTIGSLTKY